MNIRHQNAGQLHVPRSARHEVANTQCSTIFPWSYSPVTYYGRTSRARLSIRVSVTLRYVETVPCVQRLRTEHQLHLTTSCLYSTRRRAAPVVVPGEPGGVGGSPRSGLVGRSTSARVSWSDRRRADCVARKRRIYFGQLHVSLQVGSRAPCPTPSWAVFRWPRAPAACTQCYISI